MILLYNVPIENIMKKVPESLLELLKFVVPKIAHCWTDIATQLHFTKDKISQIDKAHKPTRVEDCCKEMLLMWKNQNEKEASADALIKAIAEAENAKYAEELRQGQTWYIIVLLISSTGALGIFN